MGTSGRTCSVGLNHSTLPLGGSQPRLHARDSQQTRDSWLIRSVILNINGTWVSIRHTKKYSFRQPDLKELRNLTSYVLDPLGFKARYGKLLPLLTTQVDEGLMGTLVQFYDPLYHCFTFPDFQLLPTLEEYAHLVGIPIQDQLLFSGLESIHTSQEIADMLHIDESLVKAHMTTKGGIQGLPSEFLIAQATVYGKAMSEDAFEAIFVLLIYGLVLFPNIEKFVDVNAIRIFSVLNLVPTLLGDTYVSLHLRNAKGGGVVVCCLPLLYKWFISHLPQTVAFKENKECLRWSTRLMSLTNDDISWYDRAYMTVSRSSTLVVNSLMCLFLVHVVGLATTLS
ncbi:hypothetical protein KIW84_011707 [Lathyrus oleraceus]|uniref:DUF7745 domain-containing protein n=1 Tax=Pisum sativum TaxID=3888 RepID=A0A9D5GV33_PEA|nr:hypothetical protein KIW84_011707 [Pisum sativum]